ncbi:hypothetical protein HDU97_007988 [Phlyctochytrium planicorne]|nr:hypothetical protein HDU97_007988 [Phlyctochytrium planicorne]
MTLIEITEVREKLREQEASFIQLVDDIHAIRAGKWDEKLLEGSSNEASEVSAPPKEVEDKAPDQEMDDIDVEEAQLVADTDLEMVNTEDDGMDIGKDPDGDDLSGGETSDGGPGVKEPKRRMSRTLDKKRGFRRTCNLLWGKLTDHRFGNVFLRALRDDKGSKYQELIKQPMNLTILKNRVRDEATMTFTQLHRDILLMFANAVMFNNEDSDIHQMAQAMRIYAEEELAAMQSAQLLHNLS